MPATPDLTIDALRRLLVAGTPDTAPGLRAAL